MNTSHAHFLTSIQAFIPEQRIFTDPLHTLAYGTDASFYRLIPKIVVRIESEPEIIQILQAAQYYQIPVTFRAAGTSLSGQAITDSVLIQLGDGWKGHSIASDANSITLQPGVIGAHANKYLAPFNKKIGPDPASINTAKIGGIAANNASGMCCGTAQNSYRTLRNMRVVLADGTVLDTADLASITAFKKSHAKLLQGLLSLAENTCDNTELRQKIEHKYRLKNTTGYALNALIDYQDPIDILQHLMIGSEGTLGFISSITYNTVDEHPHKASALIFFDKVHTSCEAVSLLKTTPVAAVELIDRAGLRAVEDKPGMPGFMKQLPDDAAAILVETRAPNAAQLENQVAEICNTLSGLTTSQPIEFSTDPEVNARYWGVRKGLFPAVGAIRDTGTTVIIEDVAFPVEQLAKAVHELQELFRKWHYDEALIFGHALEGNLHFVFTQAFDTQAEIDRYQGLMDDVAALVVGRYNGSLKAEHGTGRNMAPYVELEWGSDAYELMWQLKALFDPNNILSPGVILNRDNQVHLKNLKPMPAADPLVDKCIECGFCEPTCPSRDITLTPRQRIVLWREISRLEHTGNNPQQLALLRKEYKYQGDETCAACGLCSTTCPVGINTGDLTRNIRSQDNQNMTGLADWLASHYAGVTRTSRFLFRIADLSHRLLGRRIMSGLTHSLRRISGNRLQQWTPAMPTAAKKLPQINANSEAEKPRVVYLPSCASRTMGPARGSKEQASLAEVTIAILQQAGFEVIIPSPLESQCCGMPFQSKGMFSAANKKSQETEDLLLAYTEGGKIPVYSDTSPCSLRLQQQLASQFHIFDSVDFIDQFVLPKLTLKALPETVAIHITCSSTRMGHATTLERIARHCAQKVVIPDQITCCGFAGDKGFSTPELNASALRTLKSSVQHCDAGYSSSRTCEIGLTHHSGLDYQGIVYLLHRCIEANSGQQVLLSTAEQS
ncbi:FAD-binding and (Fe-S)-binding domain-containing protein [Pontibacter sp. JAM-7]|uniref:FAD-binding and (Fe-S)-binding domain-containing protein n=1 Tax=Pontibacter sp. JAM-7 TaxID=3366581 RepID=UPI003AF6F4D6